MGVLGSREPDMLQEWRERCQGCLWRVGQTWRVLFGSTFLVVCFLRQLYYRFISDHRGAGLVLTALEPSFLHCSPRHITALVE